MVNESGLPIFQIGQLAFDNQPRIELPEVQECDATAGQ